MTQCLCSCYTLWLECPSHFLGLANSTHYLRFSSEIFPSWKPFLNSIVWLYALSVLTYRVHISFLAPTVLKFSVSVYMFVSSSLPLPSFLFFFKFLFFGCIVCHVRSQFPWPWIEPAPPAVEVQSFNHWTTREVPATPFFDHFAPLGQPWCLACGLACSPHLMELSIELHWT